MAGVFKTYDIRGIYGKGIDTALAYKIGRAFAQRRQIREMAGFQEDCCRTGASSGSETDAQQQEALARKAQAMGRQMGQADAAKQLEQAAAAAQAAARAIRRSDAAEAYAN